MLLLYNLAIRLYSILIQLASLKSSKAKAWISGRANILKKIDNTVDKKQTHIWFHFASLGEFEQGRSVLEQIRKMLPQNKIVITFFSPSGYEIRKNTTLADHVFYLPADTPGNADEFIRLINPRMAIFTKYEYWFHYFNVLKKNQIPLYIVSGIFRKSQPFFKWYGGLHRKMLGCVSYFFVQNEESRNLLEGLNFRNVVVSGDTRFDRVFQNAQEPKQLEIIQDFCGQSQIFIAGSTWLPDEKALSTLPARFPEWKFIIAPHEVGEKRINEVLALFPRSVQFSNLHATSSNAQILIIDNIGMLSSLYQYADVAYIGGGFGAGIHNTLEAAAFGLPLIFGPEYRKFQEAADLIEIGAAFPIGDPGQLSGIAEKFRNEPFRLECGNKSREYVLKNIGATELIIKHIAAASSRPE